MLVGRFVDDLEARLLVDVLRGGEIGLRPPA
jgi:hypothetical protein